jgi:parvulin-like peptidyl-prolyl isomerase
MIRLTKIIFTITVLLFIFSLQCGKRADVVAKIENQEITIDEYKSALLSQFDTEDFSKISIEDKRKTLNSLIEQRLKYLMAKELKLDEDPDFKKSLNKNENQLIVKELYKIEVIDFFVPEEMIQKYFMWKQLELSAIKVIVGFNNAVGYNGQRTKAAAANRAEEVVAQMKASQNPEEVALQFSDGQGVTRDRGVVKSFPIGAYNPEVDEMVYQAEVGDVVGPIQTPKGYLILKIIGKKRLTEKSDFESEKKEIQNKLFNSYFAATANERYKELTEQFKQKYDAEIASDNVKKFHAILREWEKIPEKKDTDFTEAQREIKLAKLGEQFYTAGYLIDQFQGTFYKNYNRYNSIQLLENVVTSLLNWEVWVKEARNQNLQDEPEITKVMEKYQMQQLVILLDQKEVKEKVNVTDEEVKAYFEENKANYKDQEKIQIWEIAITDESLAKQIANRAKKGENFEDLARKYTEKQAMQKRGGNLGFQTRNSTFTEIVKRAFDAGENQIVDPFKYGIYFYVLKSGEYVPPRQKEFEEVKGIVKSGMVRKQETEKREELLSEIRKKYQFRINESILRRIS